MLKQDLLEKLYEKDRTKRVLYDPYSDPDAVYLYSPKIVEGVNKLFLYMDSDRFVSLDTIIKAIEISTLEEIYSVAYLGEKKQILDDEIDIYFHESLEAYVFF